MKRLFVGLLFVLMSVFAFAQTAAGVGNWYYMNGADQFTDEKYLALFEYSKEETSYSTLSVYLIFKETTDTIYLALFAPLHVYEKTALVRFDKNQAMQVELIRENDYIHFKNVKEMVNLIASSKVLVLRVGKNTYTFDLNGFKETYTMAYSIFKK